MRNLLKAFGIFLTVFAMLLTIGARTFVETTEAQPDTKDPKNQKISIPEEEPAQQAVIPKSEENIGEESQPEDQDDIEKLLGSESNGQGQIDEKPKKQKDAEQRGDEEPKGQEYDEQESEKQGSGEQESEDQDPETEDTESPAELDIPVSDESAAKESDNGKLTIKVDLANKRSEDKDREFNIFIYRSDGVVYTVSLTPGKSVTLKGLKYGKYKIKEIVPMDFKVKGGSIVKVTINAKQSKKKVVITNRRKKPKGLYHYDELKNTFKVGF